MRNVASVEVQKPMKQEQLKDLIEEGAQPIENCLTAFGTSEQVSIIDMKSESQAPIKLVKRPKICVEGTYPNMAWGHGLSPEENRKAVPLLAIAWEKIIKLMCFNFEKQDLVSCGYYCSELAINKLFFIGDSLLVIIIEGNQIKVLSTDLFRSGQESSLTYGKQPHEIIRAVKAEVQASKEAEIEVGHSVDGLKKGLISH